MIYSEPLYNQISRFISSIGMGFLLCVLYIIVKVFFRVIGKGKVTVMVSDGVFCLITAFVSFFYMIMENNGNVRFNLVTGQLIGGLLLYFTVGRFIEKLLYMVADMINGLLRGITYPLKLLIKSVVKLPGTLVKAFAGKIKGRNKHRKDRNAENPDKKIKLL